MVFFLAKVVTFLANVVTFLANVVTLVFCIFVGVNALHYPENRLIILNITI